MVSLEQVIERRVGVGFANSSGALDGGAATSSSRAPSSAASSPMADQPLATLGRKTDDVVVSISYPIIEPFSGGSTRAPNRRSRSS
jgi:hypothetical protein